MFSDFKYATRELRKSPGFTATAVMTLALGIGATTAIFTLIHAVLLQSLPVKDPGQLWRVGDNEQCCINGGLPRPEKNPWSWSLFSFEQYREFRDHTPGFESLAAFQAINFQYAVRQMGSNRTAVPFYGELVSGNSFETLGLKAAAGRLLRPDDDTSGAPAVAVMSFQTWSQKFANDPKIIGSSFLVNGTPVTVVGVAPPGFYSERLSSDPPAFWFPLHLQGIFQPQIVLVEHPELQWLNLIGRISPGASVGQIQAAMNTELLQFLRSPLSKIAADEQSLIPKQHLRLTPGGAGVQQMQRDSRDELYLLMWISSFVLVIACANLANLMLTESVSQMRQTAVRIALGAAPRRLIRRALVESIAVAMLGGFAGLAVAWSGAKLILHLAFPHDPVSISPDPSLPVLAFTFAVSLLTGLVFGLAPAWLAARVDPVNALRAASRVTGHRSVWAQKALVITQAAVSVVLLCAAGFLTVSLRNMQRQHLGFETAHRYIATINPEATGYKPEELDAFYRHLHDSLAAIPGVARVAYSIYSPLDGENWGEGVFIEGQPKPAPGSDHGSSWQRVSPEYFRTLGTKLIQGRMFTDADNRTGRNVAIVNQKFVKKMLRGKNPIGVHFGDWDPNITDTYEIVGVVEDVQYWGPTEEIRPMYFAPADQWTHLPASNNRASDYSTFITDSHHMRSIEIETYGDLPRLEADVRRVLEEINPNLMVVSFQSLATQVNQAFSQQNMIARLTSLFGFVALVLAAIGLYGVTAYAVAQRRSEIGIRMALGADRFGVQGMVLRGAFLQTAAGLLIGIPIAILTGKLLASQLFGVSAYNPVVLTSTIVILALATLIAGFVPARRAASVDPIEALRTE